MDSAHKNSVTAEDIPEQYQDLAEIIGVPAFIALAKYISGDTIYIPKVASVLRKKRDAAIRAEYNGYNTRKLAREYGYTPAYIRMIVGPRRAKPIKGQTSIFDEIRN